MRSLVLTIACRVVTLVLPSRALDSPGIGNLQVFPPDNAWHWDISEYAVHPNSDNYGNSVGAGESLHPDFGTVYGGAPWGIPYVVVGADEPKIPITFTAYGPESDPGPYPIPLTAPIEGGPSSTGDRHAIAVDTANSMLYELFSAYPQATYWEAASGAVFDLTSNDLRPDGWTSADAAGLAIFPGLVRYEEVANGEIDHAIRMTVDNSQKAYIYPATHYASTSTDPNRPPMGLRFRLKAGYDISTFGPQSQVVLRALKKHGMIVADNGGDWFISGAPDSRFDDDDINGLKAVKGSDFEVVATVDGNGDPVYPSDVTWRFVRGEHAFEPRLARAFLASYDIRGRLLPSVPSRQARSGLRVIRTTRGTRVVTVSLQAVIR
jgi:hypothetical protein